MILSDSVTEFAGIWRELIGSSLLEGSLKMQCHDFFSPLKHDDQVLRLYKVKVFFPKVYRNS